MANKFPLQAGDVAPDYSGMDSSTAADRRADKENPATFNQPGPNAAPQGQDGEGVIWKPCQLAPVMHQPPYDADRYDVSDEVHEVDIFAYGDAYDPTAPLKVRQFPFNFDPDHDGRPG